MIAGSLIWTNGAFSAIKPESSEQNYSENIKKASVVLNPTKDHKVKGKVNFTAVEDGVRVVADIEGLTPGEHGFHIHEHGDCSAPDATSAGGHFNPTHKKHGSPEDTDRHVGDLGNILADQNGIAHLDRVDKVISLNGPNSIIGKSIIIHEKADDFKSQPTGNAGGRVACGVIKAQ